MANDVPSSELITCRCNVCDGHIQFEREHSGSTVTCPHCGMETQLYASHAPVAALLPPLVPQAPPRVAPGVSADDYVFLYEGGIIVTKTRFMAQGQTFSLANITSVSPHKIPASHVGALCLGIGALLVAGLGIGVINDQHNKWFGVIAIIVAVFMAIWAIWLGKSAKHTYAIALSTAAGEVKTCHSRDELFIMRV